MGRSLTWTTTEDIAIALADKFPDTDPLTVRFTDLFKWVTNLEGFGDDPKNSNEKKLEAIQMAWYEEWQDRRGQVISLYHDVLSPVQQHALG